MKHEILKNQDNEITLKVDLSKEEFAEGLKHSYAKNKNRYHIPGFRKGKAPQAVIERHYGEGVFFEDAVNHCISDTYSKVLDEQSLQPASNPEFDVEEISAEKGLIYTAVFAVNPEFEIEDYKGLEIEKVDVEATDAMVDSKIDEEREKNGRMVEVERESKSGDIVNIDFVGTVDGVAFEGGSMEAHDLKLGSNSFIPGFEEQLIAHKAGDEVEVKVTFPDDYRAENLAGKDAVFACKLNAVKEIILPEPDDDFAKDVSEFDTFEEYRESVRKSLNEEMAAQKDEVKKQRIFEAVGNLMKAELHERIIETEIDKMVEQFSGQLKRQGIDPEQYFDFLGGIDKMREDMRGDAVNRLKQTLVMEKIMKKENYEVTDEDIENEYKKIADMYQISVDTVKSFYEGQGVERIKAQIEFDRAVSVLMDSAIEK